MRALLDSNAIDPVADNPGAYEALRKAVDAGQLELLFTHVNIDELCEIADPGRRSKLILLLVDLGRLVLTGSAAYGYSRYNFSRYSYDADVFEAVKVGNLGNVRDALLGSTAAFERCSLVTSDGKLTRRAQRRGITVVTPVELLGDFGWAAPNPAPAPVQRS